MVVLLHTTVVAAASVVVQAMATHLEAAATNPGGNSSHFDASLFLSILLWYILDGTKASFGYPPWVLHFFRFGTLLLRL
jgi:hypothetical protein